MRVLYILGCNEGPSKRYRVFNHIEALKAAGHHAEWIWDIHPERLDSEYISSFSIVINFRGGYNERSGQLFNFVKSFGIPLVYDVDDLVFDASAVDQIDVYRRMTPAEQQEYLSGIRSISRAMKSAEYHTTSTSFLASYIERYTGKDAWVIPFGLNDRQVEIAALTNPPCDSPRFIGYLSGTKTHQKDFAEAAPAVARILKEYDDVYLKVVGFLDTEKLLPGLEDKIVKVDLLNWEDLVLETASLWINLAPFEIDSLFCHAKSQLKFVEAALSRVPTIASPVPSFAESITSGLNGILARTEAEWHQALSTLLDNHDLHEQMSREAHRAALSRFSPQAIGHRLVEVYQDIIQQHEVKRSVSAPKDRHGLRKVGGLSITWIIPQPFEASGGHRNIFRAIRYLGEFGHTCKVHILPDNHRFSNGAEVAEFITLEFFNLYADVILGVEDIGNCDILVSTFWTTAYVSKDNSEKAALQVYFLQDFEPMFYPMGTEYVRAMASYDFGFHFITSGPWPLKMLAATVGEKEGDFFRFPIDRQIYYPDIIGHGSRMKVAFFARPHMPRRCYPLGVAALALVKKIHPDVEIVFYGDKGEAYSDVPFEFTNLGMTETIEELGDLYRTSTVGLCFSTTNPSLVPFEMMACGCPVVDLSANGNVVNYDNADNAVLVDPTPEAIAAGICSVLEDEDLRQRLSANGIELAAQFPTEVEMAKLIEGYMKSALDKKRISQSLHSQTIVKPMISSQKRAG
ncbi:glycosyltransferase family 4 protein [Brevundimonas vesicularis]|uniref:Glycosyltransferase n=1 Tax=Brevundimonas vesicularis TaxID=41276 RepID=A0ABU4KQS2_BREVE|nr:glycosyltransferase [Brevundimonas vesicularis]MDX2335353.1 glycosyltransferase [Brevundimonas vesicularis]